MIRLIDSRLPRVVGYAVFVTLQGRSVSEFTFLLLPDTKRFEVVIVQQFEFRLTMLMGDMLAVGLRALPLSLRAVHLRLLYSF